ncbi:hypothetical protein GDO81_013458 [Engystomops pustulosus]|uniref:Uncharacterized protein n=1 Tax=Engystomops pustulosus TaxID=76066 RepID=A0AAV7AZJ8_ENGPU|nr:hypothetical protein GDO81_013458 [Engystomops pustulosus]
MQRSAGYATALKPAHMMTSSGHGAVQSRDGPGGPAEDSCRRLRRGGNQDRTLERAIKFNDSSSTQLHDTTAVVVLWSLLELWWNGMINMQRAVTTSNWNSK